MLNLVSVVFYIVALIGVAILFLFAYHLYLSIPRKDEPPVRWSWIPLLGHALELGKRPIEFLQECAGLSNGIFGIVVGGKRMFIISDPFSTNVVLKPQSKSLSVEEFHNAVLTNFFNATGTVIHVEDGYENLMRRYYSQHLLSDKALVPLTDRLYKKFNELMSMLQPGKTGLSRFLGEFVFRASMGALFNDDAAKRDDLYPAFQDFDEFLPLALADIPASLFPKSVKARELLTEACDKLRDNLSDFLQARRDYFGPKEESGLLRPGDTAKMNLVMMWASVSNTMPAAFWMLYYLMSNPRCMQCALSEIDTLIKQSGGQLGDNSLTLDQLNNSLPYLDCCFTESLRLSSGSLIMRGCTEATDITLNDGRTFKLRKGDRIGMCPPLFHLDEDFFPNARSFQPERWLSKEGVAIDPTVTKYPLYKQGREVAATSVFLPFGAGLTLCPGRRFARNEVKVLLCFLLSRFSFAFASESDREYPGVNAARAGLGIFPPKREVMVSVTPRQQQQM